jgi:hypothetical protein
VQTDKTRELRDDFEVWQYPTVVRVVESVVCKVTCVYEAVVALRGDGSPEMPRRGELRHSWQASNLNTTAISRPDFVLLDASERKFGRLLRWKYHQCIRSTRDDESQCFQIHLLAATPCRPALVEVRVC